jgi:hypothetical protein
MVFSFVHLTWNDPYVCASVRACMTTCSAHSMFVVPVKRNTRVVKLQLFNVTASGTRSYHCIFKRRVYHLTSPRLVACLCHH